MTINWPSFPNTGDQVTGPRGEVWQWDSEKWVAILSGRMDASPHMPDQRNSGDLWYNTDTRVLYIWHGGWIDIGGPGPPAVSITLTTLGAFNWTVPPDWNSQDNKIECWGAGGAANGRFGGGGGAYSAETNLGLMPGTVIACFVGAGPGGIYQAPNPAGSGQSSYFGVSPHVCFAVGGGGGTFNGPAGPGGAATSGVGAIRYSGGAGGTSIFNNNAHCGGGAAGPHGNGLNGEAPTAQGVATRGGQGDNGQGGLGGLGIVDLTAGASATGANGVDHPNGGGGGGGAQVPNASPGFSRGGHGGFPGGGGGASFAGASQIPGNGANGQIRISYTPPRPTLPETYALAQMANARLDAAAGLGGDLGGLVPISSIQTRETPAQTLERHERWINTIVANLKALYAALGRPGPRPL